MITIVHGPRSALRALTHARCRETPLVLEADVSQPAAMDGVRHLLPRLRAALGDSAVEDALAPHRAIASLVLRRLVPQLDPAELAAREASSASFQGMLPNTGLHARPLVEAFAAAIAALLTGRSATLLVADTAAIDTGTLMLLRPLLRRMTPGELSVVVGHDSGFVPSVPLLRRLQEIKADEVRLLGALPGACVARLPDTLVGALDAPAAADAAAPPAPAELLADPLDDALERRAYQALARLDRTADDLIVATTRASFACFGFATSLRLARALLERQPAHPQAAELHTLASLSALNLAAPFAGSDDVLQQQAGAHLESALALESDPRRRVSLLYRRCLRVARKDGAFDRALQIGTEAITAAQTAGFAPALGGLMEAWCRNARGYALFRSGRLADAAADCEAALELLAQAERAPEVPAVEVEIARFHMLNNLARLAYLGGDRARAQAWQRLSLACEQRIPHFRRTYYRWYERDLDLDDLDGAAERYAARLAEARHDWAPHLEALYAWDLAIVQFRRGDAAAAYAHYENARRLREALGGDVDELRVCAVNCAVAAYRAGRLEQARRGFERLLADPELSEGGRAELHGALAMVAAAEGAAASADQHADRALLAATAAGEPGTVVRVVRSIGDACLLLGRPQAARRMFERAAALGEASDAAVPPEDRMGVLIGLREAGNLDPAFVARALALLPAALADDNAWWDVPRLLRALDAVDLPAQWRAEARRLVDAARQRLSCGETAARLRRRLQDESNQLR